MKIKYFSLSVIFSLLFSTGLFSQVSVQQADSIVRKYVETEISDYHWLYSSERIVANNNGVTTLFNWEKEPISVNKSCFVYFVDEYPYANWEHPCRYLFVDKSNGQIYEKKATSPPENMRTWKTMTPLPNLPQGAKFDFSKNIPNLRSGISPQNCYAVIISGGYDDVNNWERYWNDCSAIYSVLIYVYGYSKDNIYVLMSDGTNPAIDRHLNDYSYDSSPLDLDGDGLPDIQYAATKNDITTVFNTLSNILTPDDNLFIFTTDHGGTTGSGEATLRLWHETATASEFATEVDKINAGEISITMEQCYSGGFVPHLAKQGRVIATACSGTELSHAMPPSFTYNEFVYHWTAAVAGYIPNGGNVTADNNNDGYISMKEAFDYADLQDTRAETPQYNSIESYLGDCLTLLGKLQTTVNFTNQIITTDTTVTSCGDINVQNVKVQNGAKLTLDAEGEVNIGIGFEVELGSEFEIVN